MFTVKTSAKKFIIKILSTEVTVGLIRTKEMASTNHMSKMFLVTTHQLLLMHVLPILLIRIIQSFVPSVHKKCIALFVPLPVDPKPIRQLRISDVSINRTPSRIRLP